MRSEYARLVVPNATTLPDTFELRSSGVDRRQVRSSALKAVHVSLFARLLLLLLAADQAVYFLPKTHSTDFLSTSVCFLHASSHAAKLAV